MTGKLFKWIVGTVGTLGLVMCPVPHATAPQTVAIDPRPIAEPGTTPHLPSHATNLEPIAFDRGDGSPNPAPHLPRESTPQVGQTAVELGAPIPGATALPGSELLTQQDRERFQRLMQMAEARSLHRLPMGEIVQTIADHLIGSRYQANLLDQPPQERLVVSLTQFDCVLFVETVLALAQGVAQQDYSYQTFTHSLQSLRYRDGVMDGYCSRLHYFSDWIGDNQRRANVQNISLELGGISLPKMLNFMSGNRQSYARLNDARTYQCVRQMESTINPFLLSYLPYHQIRQNYSRLQAGDIVAIATDIPGLDVTHTGLVYRDPGGGLGLIHATPGKGVIVSPDLQRYVNQVQDAIGVLLVRPVDPRQRSATPPPRIL